MNTKTTILSFDQTFEGFLSAVYTAIDEQLNVVEVCPVGEKSTFLFDETRHVQTDRRKACWVWDWLYNKGTADLRLVYFAFLSEKEELLLPILEFITGLFRWEGAESGSRLSAIRGQLAPWARRVEREKQKLEAHLGLQSRPGEFRCSHLRPVHDILPLLTRYCREHFGSEPWMLVDTKRRYGLRKGAEGVEYFRLPADSFAVSNKITGNTGPEKHADGLSHSFQPLQEAV